MQRSHVILAVLLPVLAAGCDQLKPKIVVNLEVIEPCDQQSLSNVATMQVIAEDGDGKVTPTQVSRSSGAAKLNIDISDGTQVFINGYEGDVSSDPSVITRVPLAAGASVPMNLEAYQASNRFPAARQYPASQGGTPWAGSNASIRVPVGKVNSFASTTDASAGSCSQMVQGRHGHTATFLSESGLVVIIGGLTYAQDGAETFVPKDRAIEVYDPLDGTFSTPSMGPEWLPLMQRAFHTATALPDGSVLVWGGIGPEGDGTRVSPRAISFVLKISSEGSVQVGTLAAAQGFSIKRFHHQATLTRSGTAVVITGGCGCVGGTLSAAQIKAGMCPSSTETCTDGMPRVAAVETYDAHSGNITQLSTTLFKARAFHNAVALEGELVVVVGGDDGTSPVRDVEVYQGGGQPRLLSPPQDSLDVGAVTHAASVVLNASDCASLLPAHVGGECVMVTGGCLEPLQYAGSPLVGTCNTVRTTATILDFDPGLAGGSRRKEGPTLMRARYGHGAYVLPQGRHMVMLAGGRFALDGGGGTPPDTVPVSAELLSRVGQPGARPFNAASFMVTPRLRFASTVFQGGQVLLTGGVPSLPNATTPAATSLGSGELFFFQFRNN
jgi:hypothetical protein